MDVVKCVLDEPVLHSPKMDERGAALAHPRRLPFAPLYASPPPAGLGSKPCGPS